MNTQKLDDFDQLAHDTKDLADEYPQNKSFQILHGVAKATVDNTKRISMQTRLGLLGAVGGAIIAIGGIFNGINHKNLAGRVSELESAPKASGPSAQGGDLQKNPVQPQQVPPVQESKPEPHTESMPPVRIKPQNKGKKARPHSGLAAIMRGDNTDATNSKMVIAMKGHGTDLKIEHGANSMPYRGPDPTIAQSRSGIRMALRGNIK